MPTEFLILGLLVSLVFEMHLAAGFVALYWRQEGLMRFLRCSLFLPWALLLPGILFALLPPSAHLGVLHGVEMTCALVAVTTLCLYGCASFRTLWYPSSAEQKAARMLWLYPVGFIVTDLPYIATRLQGWQSPIGELALSLNGLVNVVVYSCVSSFSPLIHAGRSEGRIELSELDKWSGIRAFPVGFALGHEVVEVDVRRPSLRTMV